MWSRDLVVSVGGLPEHEAVRLMVAATGRSRSAVVVGFDVSPDQKRTFERFVQRRLGDEPLQYIEGSVPFGPVELAVDSRVLIPRPETEFLFEQIIESVSEPRVIVDLCTGSGNLALALAAAYPDAEVHAVDISRDAVDVARANAAANGLAINIVVGDLFDPLPESIRGCVDLLVANPPYLGADELKELPADVLAEPKVALVAGPRGDEVLGRIAAGAEAWLAPGGVIACEISEFHAHRIAGLFDSYEPEIRRDLAERERFVFGTLRTK